MRKKTIPLSMRSTSLGIYWFNLYARPEMAR